MADLSTLARPYAKAAFDYAKENRCVNEWQNYLTVMSAIVSDKAFETYLNNPAVSALNKVDALRDIYNASANTPEAEGSIFEKIVAVVSDIIYDTEDKPSNKVSDAFGNFLTQLAEQDRLALLPTVTERFTLLQAEDAKEVHAYVTSAYPLTKEQELLIENRLSSSLSSKVIIHVEVDPSLLAGVTIKVGDKLIDDSVRGKLKSFQTQLTA